MKRLASMVALALVAVLVLAPSATAQQMNGKHMMPDGTMMDNSQMMGGNTMASPSASASATPNASDNGRMMGGNTMMSPSASAAVYGQLPDTGGTLLVSVGALVLLGGLGLAATRLLRRST